MIAEAGHYALVLALFIAVIQAVMPMIGAHRGNETWMSLDKPTAYSQVLLIAFAFGCLTYAHVESYISHAETVMICFSAQSNFITFII